MAFGRYKKNYATKEPLSRADWNLQSFILYVAKLLQQTLGRVSERAAGGVITVHCLSLEGDRQSSYCCSYMYVQSESSTEAYASNEWRLVYERCKIILH